MRQKYPWQDVFGIIASLHSETKIIILHTIWYSQKDLNINQLVSLIGFQRSNVSKQLKTLLQLGVLDVVQEGRERFYQINQSLASEKKEMIKSILIAYQKCSCSEGKIILNS